MSGDGTLSPMQAMVVTEGFRAPTDEAVDLSRVVFTERVATPGMYGEKANTDGADLDSAHGYLEVTHITRPLPHGQQWFAYHATAGGSSGKMCGTREEALEELRQRVGFHLAYSRAHIAKLAADPHALVVADGRVLSVGKEPTVDRWGNTRRDGLGFGGARFHVRWLDGSGDVISHNMWSGGRIVTELREQCPDNAVIIMTGHCGDRRSFHDPHVWDQPESKPYAPAGQRSCTGYAPRDVNEFVIRIAHDDAEREQRRRNGEDVPEPAWKGLL